MGCNRVKSTRTTLRKDSVCDVAKRRFTVQLCMLVGGETGNGGDMGHDQVGVQTGTAPASYTPVTEGRESCAHGQAAPPQTRGPLTCPSPPRQRPAAVPSPDHVRCPATSSAPPPLPAPTWAAVRAAAAWAVRTATPAAPRSGSRWRRRAACRTCLAAGPRRQRGEGVDAWMRGCVDAWAAREDAAAEGQAGRRDVGQAPGWVVGRFLCTQLNYTPVPRRPYQLRHTLTCGMTSHLPSPEKAQPMVAAGCGGGQAHGT